MPANSPKRAMSSHTPLGPGRNKRRRIDSNISTHAAASALHKPFRTPLKTQPSLPSSLNRAIPANSSPGTSKPETVARSRNKNSIPWNLAQSRGSESTCVTKEKKESETVGGDGDERSRGCALLLQDDQHNLPESSTPGTTKSRQPCRVELISKSPHTLASDFSNPSANHHIERSPANGGNKATSDRDVVTAQKKQRSLEQTLRNVRADIDTLEQALRIERRRQQQQVKHCGEAGDSKDIDENSSGPKLQSGGARLESLIAKWRDVSRQAAEEIFEGARERISRMGGVSAWREREREKKSWQAECSGDRWGWSDGAAQSKRRERNRHEDGSDDGYANDKDIDDDDDVGEQAERANDEGDWEYDAMLKEKEKEEEEIREKEKFGDDVSSTSRYSRRNLTLARTSRWA